jgi:hypothetical protein
MNNKAASTRDRQMPVVLRSIPIRKDLKRYYWRKYEALRRDNGPKYAASVFQNLRTQLMGLRQEGAHVLTSKEELKKIDFPVRKNGWFYLLCSTCAAQPSNVFQFLKLYTTEEEPLVTPEESAMAQSDELRRAQPGPTPIVLIAHARLMSYPWQVLLKERRLFEDRVVSQYSHFVYWKGGTYFIPGPDYASFLSECGYYLDDMEKAVVRRLYQLLSKRVFPRMSSESGRRELGRYWKRWRNALSMDEPNQEWSEHLIREALPTDADYADTNKGAKRNAEHMSNAMSIDINELIVLSSKQRDRMEDFWRAVPDTTSSVLDDWWAVSRMPNRLLYKATEDPHTWASGVFAGSVHHIPKKGTVKRRPIAAPNKFFQAMMRPCQKSLRSVTGKLPRNAQFNQTRFNREIKTAVDKGLASCWDLHQATDWLPLSWFELVSRELGWFQEDTAACRSYHWYLAFSRAQWLNETWDNDVSWQRGQPLGTWPSFEVLTITHHLVLEAISFWHGRLDSPYAICGDDNVIWDSRVSRHYYLLMERAGCPLSLHKSFSGQMVEFAGQLFIKNQLPVYSPSLYLLHLTNLYDFQRVAQHAIRWKDLPKKVREKFASCCAKHNEQAKPRNVYLALQGSLGIPVPKISDEIGMLIENVAYHMASDKLEPLGLTGNTWHQWNGYLLTFGSLKPLPLAAESSNEDGKGTAHTRPVADWFRRKYRPESTRTLIEYALT